MIILINFILHSSIVVARGQAGGAAPTVLLVPMTGRGRPGAPDLLPGSDTGALPGGTLALR